MSSTQSQHLSEKQSAAHVPEMEQIAEEFVTQLRAGKTPSISDYMKRYPDVASEIEECFPAIAALESGKFVNHSDGKVSLVSGRPQQLGDFKIVQEIGRGGMGVVYEAIQESLNRRVAVKVLPRHALLEPKQLKRFQREAEIAASLHHSHIVPVFGVGENDGFHFYVMQLIDGIGLDELLQKIVTTLADSASPQNTPADNAVLTQIGNQTSLPVQPKGDEERSVGPFVNERTKSNYENFIATPQAIASLGIQAANALQYAHDRGILHRDIKPGNLLLDGNGLLCITDFGLARATEQNDMSKTTDVVGTLGYMAPEMFRSETCSQSDIYGLGITLYELLTRRAAIERKQRHQMIEQINKGSITPLRRINPQISRDLETIILKTIAPEVNHRYEKASDLADDLQHYLENRPIRARRVTPVERLWRWSRRNPAVAMLSGLACLLIMLLGVTLGVGFHREREQRKQAEASSALATEAIDRVFDRFVPRRVHSQKSTSLAGSQSQPVLSRESATLLAEMVQFYEKLAELTGDQREFQLKAANAQQKVGDIHHLLGDHQAALKAYQKSLALFQRNPSQSDQLTVASLMNEIGSTYRLLGQQEDAKLSHQKAEQLLQEGLSQNKNPSALEYELAHTYFLMARKLRGNETQIGMKSPRHHNHKHHEQTAEFQQLQQAVDILSKLTNTNQPNPEYQYLLALCLQEKVSPLLPQSKKDKTTQAQVVTILEGLVQKHPQVADYRQALVASYERIDIRLVDRHDIDKSLITSLEKAVQHASHLVSDHPTIPQYKVSLVHSHNKLAHVLEEIMTQEVPLNEVRHRHDAAELSRRAALRLQEELVAQFPESNKNKLWLAKFQSSLAQLLHRKRNDKEAKELLTKALPFLEAELEKEPSSVHLNRDLRDVTDTLARIYDHDGEENKSQAMWKKSDKYNATLNQLRPDDKRPPHDMRHPPDDRRPPPRGRPLPPFRR